MPDAHPAARHTRRAVLGGIAGSLLAGTAVTALGTAGHAAAPHPGRPGRRGKPCSPTPPRAVTATKNAALNTAFNAYGDTGAGWTGADSTYSTPLPDGSILWMFSDTFLGPVNPDGSRPTTAPFLHNSFVRQRGGTFTTIHGGTANEPDSLVSHSDPDRWYWIGAGSYLGGSLQLPLLEFHRFGSGPWDWGWSGNALARFSLADLSRPADITPLPSGAGVSWGMWLQPHGAFTYLYGVEDKGADKYLHIARVAGTDLRGTWSYWDGSGFSPHEADSVRVMVGISNEFSVTRFGDRWVLITQDTRELFSTKILAYVGCAPTGPFTSPVEVYRTPETGADGTYQDPDVFTYNPHAHLELSSGNRMVISYNVNTFDNVGDVYRDVTIYRPRFVDVDFTW